MIEMSDVFLEDPQHILDPFASRSVRVVAYQRTNRHVSHHFGNFALRNPSIRVEPPCSPIPHTDKRQRRNLWINRTKLALRDSTPDYPSEMLEDGPLRSVMSLPHVCRH